MQTNLATQQNKDLFTLSPKSLEEAMQYAGIIAESELVPKDYRGKPGNVLVAVQMGAELGLPPMQSLQNIAVINGRPSIWGDALKAVVMAHPLCEYIKEWWDPNTSTAWCETKRVGQEPSQDFFSLQMAKDAGLLGKQGPWSQYKERMCKMRARGFCLRDTYPDVLKGIAVAEEMNDMERDISGGDYKTSSLKPKPKDDDVINHESDNQTSPFDTQNRPSISKRNLLDMIRACESGDDFRDVHTKIAEYDRGSIEFAELAEAFNKRLEAVKATITQEH